MHVSGETLPAVLRAWAQQRPDALFCTFLEGETAREITFAELWQRSASYAAAYRARGVAPGATVIVILQHSPHQYYAFLGALLAGAVPAFLPFPSVKQRPDVYWADLAKLFARIEPGLVVTYAENARAARATLGTPDFAVMLAGEDILAMAPASIEVARFDPDATAVLQHSSGTTGVKKGVMLTHRDLIRHARALDAALHYAPDEATVSWLPLYHDMGFIACFVGSVVRGSHLIALDPFAWVARPARLLDAIAEYRPAFCWLPNFAFAHLARAVPATRTWDLSSIRAFINCSEPGKPATFERFLARFGTLGVTREQLHVSYAMAENVFGVTQTPLDRPATVLTVDREAMAHGRLVPGEGGAPEMRLLSCGIPLDGVELAIRADDGTPHNDGTIGEIWIRSPFLFSGYDRLPERTAKVLRNGWYRSGDLGAIVAGELYVTGRTDDMIIVNGRNFYAHDIEMLINDEPEIIPGRCVAVAVALAESDATSVAVLVETETAADDPQLKRRIKERVFNGLALALHAVTIVPRGTLLKTTSGKLDRNRNTRLYAESLGETTAP